MASPETTYPETVALRDGSRLVVRPIRSEDKDAIVAGFERMSAESRFRRFFSPLHRLSDRDLEYLTEVDHHNHEALIGFDRETGGPVGVARFVRGHDRSEAEVAVTVIDDWQGRGAASALLNRLVERAREEGVEHFLALVLEDNVEVIELFEHLAPEMSVRDSDSGNVELLIPLPEPGRRLPRTGLGHALREAAAGTVIANPWRVIRDRIARLR